MSDSSLLSRRDFLKVSGTVSAALLVSTQIPSGESLLREITGEEKKELEASAEKEEKYVVGTTAGPVFAWVKNGRIFRITPLEATVEEWGRGAWTIEARGKTFKPWKKWPILYWGTAARKWIYSPYRILYPLKRVDWDPAAPPDKRNQANRGKSGYVRITWDEALEIASKEIRRIKETYGTSAILMEFHYHPEWGSFNYTMSTCWRFWNMIGHTPLTCGAVSWEGWASGTAFMYGFWTNWGCISSKDLEYDILKNSDLIVLWGGDVFTKMIYQGLGAAIPYLWYRDAGIPVIQIDPYRNDTGCFLADKWIPIIPGTDAALAAAIAYVWITEGTYDKEYLNKYTIGFDEEHLPSGAPPNSSFKSYILGKVDGIPKTPEWAEKITGVPARTIKALARLWASKKTSLHTLYSGACRRDYAEGWTRMMATLQAMQGLGKPGINLYNDLLGSHGPMDLRVVGPPGYARGGMNIVAKKAFTNPVPQELNDNFIDEAILEGKHVEWQASGVIYPVPEIFFAKHEYPMPGYSKIHMIYEQGVHLLHTKVNANRFKAVFQHPDIETVIVQAPWFESDARYADLVLPACINFERHDIVESASSGWLPPNVGGVPRVALYHQKPINPLGESKTDYEIYTLLSEKLGLKDDYTEGNSEEDWIKKLFDITTTLKEGISYEEFKRKGYYVLPFLKDYVWEPIMTAYYRDPSKNKLDTPSGKIEIFSTLIFKHYGTAFDSDIPAFPAYIPEVEGRNSPLAAKYSLQLNAPHPKFRFHGKFDRVSWFDEIYRVKGLDGYLYQPILIHPVDAGKRGIRHGDIVRVYNERGEILAGAVISERVVPGEVLINYGSWSDPLEPRSGALERGGNANYLTPDRPLSGKHHMGAFATSTLVEVEKVDLEELARRYPEGWAGKFRSWVWRVE
jgi:trimethylamine-N-oxide reductase (cytochrome c)